MNKNQNTIPILVVEDDEGLNKLIQMRLKRAGFIVDGVTSGQDALEHIRQNPKVLMLLDYQLGDLTGADVIDKLNKENIFPWFVMITGRGDERVAVDTMKLGARDYVVKEAHFLDVIPTIVSRTVADIQTDLKLKEVEYQFKVLSARHKAILDTVPGIIVEVDKDKIYRWANKAGVDFFGDDILGREASEFFIEEQDVYEKVQPVFAGDEEVVYLESLQRRSDGEPRTLAWWCKSLKDENENVIGAISTATDITERKLAEETLHKSETFNRSIIENSLDCIKTLDKEGRLLFMSPGGQTLLEIKDINKYLGQSWIEFWKEEDQGIVRQAVSEAAQGDIGRFQAFSPTETGKPKWWDVVISPIPKPDGSIDRLLAVSRDITNNKQAEEVLKKRMNEIDRTNKLFIGREYRVAEMKREVNALLEKLGQPKKYLSSDG